MKYFAFAMSFIGLSLIIGGNLFWLFSHPEWTQPQALVNLWPVWLAGASACVGGIFLAQKA
jgi:hypothetical protein